MATLLPNNPTPEVPHVPTKTYFVIFELQRVLVNIQNVGESDISGLVHSPADSCLDEVSLTLVGTSDLVRVRTNFIEFWEKVCALKNVFPVIWSDLPYARVRDITSFLFQECTVKPGRIFSRYDMVEMRDAGGFRHRKPISPGSLKRWGDVYYLKDLRSTLWTKPYQWNFNPMPPEDVHPDASNTLLIDGNRETTVLSPGNVLYPFPWYGPLDRHSNLVKNLFPFIENLARSGEPVRDFMKKNCSRVPGDEPLDGKAHVLVELRKWQRAK